MDIGYSTTMEGKKRFITASEVLVNRHTALTILQVIMQDVGEKTGGVLMESRSGTDVNLDALEAASPETLTLIYNIVRARVVKVNTMPAK